MDNFGEASGDGMRTNAAKLMNPSKAGNDGMVCHFHMSGEGAVVGENHVIANLAVVGNVRVSEKEIVRTDPGGGFRGGAPVDGGVFPENIAVPNDKGGRFPGIFQVLRFEADGGEGKKLVFLPNFGGSVKDDMRVKDTAITESDTAFDHTVRPDLAVFAKSGFGRNDGGGMDHADDQEGLP